MAEDPIIDELLRHLRRPRFMTDQGLREHFGLSDRALRRLRAVREFPKKDVLVGRTDSKAVDRFFDSRSGLDSTSGYSRPDGKENWDRLPGARTARKRERF